MKRNRMMRLASGLLVAVLLTTSVISGTFAKYTSEATASDSARVAKWAFEVGNDNNIAVKNDFQFDLFKYVDGNVDVNGADDNATVIAPGTTGSFDIVLNNKSEVVATYAIDYTVENNGVPLEFSVDGGLTWTEKLANVTANTVTLAANDGTTTVKVQWRWAFTGGESANYTTTQTDLTDTDLGKNAYGGAAASPVVTAKITATQVD